MAPPPEDSPYQLLVEGRDDYHSVIHLMKRHGFDWNDESTLRPYVSAREGIADLLRVFPSFLRSAAYQRIGIVVDANSDLGQRWAQIRTSAERESVHFPDAPDSEGTIVHGQRPGMSVGIWVMPDNSLPGALEDFLSRLVPADDPIRDYAHEVVIEARQRGARCLTKDHLKSTLHTWLAWQEEPGLPFGTALKAEIFGKESKEALAFVAWFCRLFVDS